MANKFIRKDQNKKRRIPENWRRPKGITNKRRLNRKGHAANVRTGYGTKATERGKNKQGLMIVSVATIEQLKAINPKTQAALIAGVGKKRKTELIAEAEKLKLTLVNLNVAKYKAKVAEFLKNKKSTADKKKEEKEEEKKADNKKETAEKKEEKEEKTPEQKKKEEKAEKDKVLINNKNQQ